jgi:hypothetical protein
MRNSRDAEHPHDLSPRSCFVPGKTFGMSPPTGSDLLAVSIAGRTSAPHRDETAPGHRKTAATSLLCTRSTVSEQLFFRSGNHLGGVSRLQVDSGEKRRSYALLSPSRSKAARRNMAIATTRLPRGSQISPLQPGSSSPLAGMTPRGWGRPLVKQNSCLCTSAPINWPGAR